MLVSDDSCASCWPLHFTAFHVSSYYKVFNNSGPSGNGLPVSCICIYMVLYALVWFFHTCKWQFIKVAAEWKQIGNFIGRVAGGPGCYIFFRAVVFTQLMHHCHHEFIMRRAIAGPAVNEFNWLLTAEFALWSTSNTGRLAKKEGGRITEFGEIWILGDVSNHRNPSTCSNCLWWLLITFRFGFSGYKKRVLTVCKHSILKSWQNLSHAYLSFHPDSRVHLLGNLGEVTPLKCAA